ncbi:B12-binding domain-containing radical SAM protein [Chloroflexota bacterium]
MRILLINPPQGEKYPQPPLGLASIAAILEKNRYDVEILDANALQLSEVEIAERVGKSEVVGLTAMTPTIKSAIRIAERIKVTAPDSIVILGGPHATILPTETLSNVPQIDIIVMEEGEDTILELLHALSYSKGLGNVNGITYRDNGEIKSTPARPQTLDLDAQPFLPYHLLPMKKYKLHPPYGRESSFMALMTTRGCPYNCMYCSKPVFGSKCREQSPKRTADELSYLSNVLKIREVRFYDDVFTLSKERTVQLTEELNQRGIDISWSCETRVNLVSQELLMRMKTAGCYMIAYGIESGNQDILDNLRKKITIEQIEKAVEMTHKAGIQSVGYFMLGSPGETPETIRQTIDFAKRLELDFAQFSVTIPFPGTDLYELYLEQGYDPSEWGRFIYTNLNLTNSPVFETALLSKEDLQEWNAKAYKEFYLRLRYLWLRFTRMRTIGDLKTNIKGMGMLFDMMRSA